MSEHFLPSGTVAEGDFVVSIDPDRAGWQQCGIHVLKLRPGASRQIHTGDSEWLSVPLNGAFSVEVGGQTHVLRGRRDVFTGPTDVLYLPIDTTATIHSETGGRIAFPTARTDVRHPVQFLAAQDAPIGRRGAGNMSRYAHEYLLNSPLKAEKLIALEVYTPGGNWSSYPPHKHDVDTDAETQLEEIYYFEVAPGPDGQGMGYQRVYASDERPIDVLAEVRSQDVVLVPYGWHGPAMAAPGYDLYYLNVMSGTGESNQWLFSNDPRHEWVRQTWDQMPFDSRLD